MDTACLETQFRALGRQCQCQHQSNTDADAFSLSSLITGAAGDEEFVGEAGRAAAKSAGAGAGAPRTIACGGDCGGSLENQSLRGRGAAGGGRGGGEQQPSRGGSIANSDARSRLSGAATGMVGGATAVVAIATKVGEVRRVWLFWSWRRIERGAGQSVLLP